MNRRVWGVLLCVAQAGCADPVSAPSDTEGTSSSSDDTGSTAFDETGGLAPVILDAPDAVAPGSILFVVVDQPLNMLTVRLGDTALEPERFLMTDVPAGLFHVPPGVALGPATLRVEWRDDPALADTRPVEIAQRLLEDVATQVGLDVVHDASGSPPECAESHTGLAWGDYDADGVLDVYLGNVGSAGTLHRGRLTPDGVAFEEVTADVGIDADAVSMATFVDLEGDGDADLYVGRRGENRMFRNLRVESGEAVFEEVGASLGLVVDSQRTMGVAFGDYDGDGDLDLYEVNHAFCFPQQGSEVRARDHLFENVSGVFVDRTDWVDAPVLDSVGFSAAWLDTDRDGDLDLVVINDDVGGMIGQPNAHWRNDGAGPDGQWQFTEVGAQTGLALAGINGMGLAYGDLDDDGFVDVAFSNIGRNLLMLSRADGTWSEVEAGPARGQLPWGRNSITWAVHLPDLDNDGDLDFYASGGRIKGQNAVVDALFLNDGSQRFTEQTWSSGAVDPGHAKASALVDFDGDGGLDIVTTAWGQPVRVYRNRAAAGQHWIAIELEQAGANRDALGSVVTLEAGGRSRTCFHSQRPSLGGGSQLGCHFGLGTTTTIDALRVQWPDGESTEHAPPVIDQRVRIAR